MMKNTAYDLVDLVSLQQWQKSSGEDNHQRLERLLRQLPVAVAEELTPRQQQLLRMFYYDGKTVTVIARNWPSTNPLYPAHCTVHRSVCANLCAMRCKEGERL